MFSAVKDLLWKGKGVTFEPTYILKVTWDEMAPTYKSKLTEVSVLDRHCKNTQISSVT